MSTETKEQPEVQDVVMLTLDAIVSHPGKLMAKIEEVTSGNRFDSVTICAHFLSDKLKADNRCFQIDADSIHRRTLIAKSITYIDDQLRALNVIQSLIGRAGVLPYEAEKHPEVKPAKNTKNRDIVMETIAVIAVHPAELMESIREINPNAYFQNVEHAASELTAVLAHPGQTHLNAHDAGIYNTRINSAVAQLNDQKEALFILQQTI